MDYNTSYRLARLYFRRVCTVETTTDGMTTRTLDRARLLAIADTIAASAMEEVLITSAGMDGGTGSGVAKFRKDAAAIAIEELLLEADGDAPREVCQTVVRFR